MAASKKKSVRAGKRPAAKAAGSPKSGPARAAKTAPAAAGAPAPRKGMWLVPVCMLLVLVGVGAFIVGHARYLASLKFDMVREARIVPQGHDQGQGTNLVNLSGDAQGHMFMLESPAGGPVRLQRFDRQNSPDTLVYKPAKPGQDLTAAVDVDCDPKGDVYVLLQDGRIQVLDNDLKYLRGIQTGIAHAAAAVVDSEGRIYVADNADSKVLMFGPDGRRAGELGAPGKGDVPLVSPCLLRLTLDDELVVVENTPTGLRGRVFTKDHVLRKTFLVDKIQQTPWVRLGVNSQRKAFFNDQGGTLGIVCWDLVTGKYVGASQETKDGVQFTSPGSIGADRYTPDVYVHTIPGLIKCLLPSAGGDK